MVLMLANMSNSQVVAHALRVVLRLQRLEYMYTIARVARSFFTILLQKSIR